MLEMIITEQLKLQALKLQQQVIEQGLDITHKRYGELIVLTIAELKCVIKISNRFIRPIELTFSMSDGRECHSLHEHLTTVIDALKVERYFVTRRSNEHKIALRRAQ